MAEARVDFEWDDDHVMPEVVNPEVDFLFKRMIEVTHKTVDPLPGERILDVGCGRGTDGVELGRKGAIVVGLEPSRIMIGYAQERVGKNGVSMDIVHGVSEHLPFHPGAFDKVVCKGALDHFADPSEAIGQMGGVLRPGGHVIIAIANFDSLGFKLGKLVCRLKKWVGLGEVRGRMPWDIPDDHTFRFTHSNLRAMAGEHLLVEHVTGVSLFFGLPYWGSILARLPHRVSWAVLDMLDRIARLMPSISDVVVLKGRRKTPVQPGSATS